LDQIAWRSGEAELKITIYEERHHSQGYGTTAILALLEETFFRMNLRRIYLRVHASNTIAMRCYKKVGFKKEGPPGKAHRRGHPGDYLPHGPEQTGVSG